MNENKILSWLIEIAEERAKIQKLSPEHKKIFDARILIAQEIKRKLKRLDYGGLELLINKSSIITDKEKLF